MKLSDSDSNDSGTRWVWQGCAAFAAISLFALHQASGHESYPSESHVYAGMLGALAIMSFAFMDRFSLPVLPLFLTQIYASMGLPTFFAPALKGVSGPVFLSKEGLARASLAALVFASTATASSLLLIPAGRSVGAIFGRLDPQGGHGWQLTFAIRAMAAVSLIIYFAGSMFGLKGLGQLAFAVSLVALPPIHLGLLYWDMRMTGTPLSQTLLWLAAASAALSGMASGMLGSMLLPMLTLIVMLWTDRGRIPKTLIVVGVLILFVLNPAKHTYRTLTWNSDRVATLAERSENWLEAIAQTYSSDLDTGIEKSSESTRSRISVLATVAQVCDWVPSVMPHAGIEVWLKFPLEFVPRALWPDKPVHNEVFNKAYTLAFGLQTGHSSETTTLNLASVADGWWRLGWLGVVLEGLFLGLVSGFFRGLANADSPVRLIAATGFAVWAQPDRHVLQAISGLPQMLVVIAAVMLCVGGVARALGHQSPADSTAEGQLRGVLKGRTS